MAALATRQGFDEEDAGRAALVAMEICSNLVKHGGGGELIVQPLERGDRRGVGLLGLDKGPGIADLAKCLRDGFSTGGSPGTGLGAINRMSQRVRCVFAARARHGGARAAVAGQPRAARAQRWRSARSSCRSRARSSAATPGAIVERAGGALVMGVDGLGHGLGAAQAASLACEVFMTEKTRAPGAVLERMHTNLRTTRGAAVIVIEIDWDQRPAAGGRHRQHGRGHRRGRLGRSVSRPTTASSDTPRRGSAS